MQRLTREQYQRDLGIEYLKLRLNLPQKIEELKQCKVLDKSNKMLLNEISISDRDMLEKIPNSICELIELTELNLSNNKIEYLPESIGKLKQLKYLYLTDNKLEYLPKSIVKLKQLQYLYLTNNLLKKLHNSVGELKMLLLEMNELTSLPILL